MPPRLSFPRAARFAASALWTLLGGPVSLCAAPAVKSAPWFTDVTKASGLDTTVRPVPYNSFELPDILTPGVALHDFDRDGDLDLYFTNDLPDFGRPRSVQTPHNHYFRNDAGHFIDATAASGLAHAGYGFGVAVGDIDNDGDLDLFAANYDRDLLFRNRGNGVFDNVSPGLRIAKDGWSASAAFVDYDGDGFLDLTVNQYAVYDSSRSCRDNSGRPDFCGPKDFPPLSELLLHNRGDGTFDDITAAAGLFGAKGAGLGVICEDFNLDGKQDVYVANDGYSNNLWMNRGSAKFDDEALLLGCALNSQGIAEAGMGVVAFDYDADLDLDVFITHLRNETNTLFKNLGARLGFDDATAVTGLGPPSLPYTGFGTAAFDVELDGDVDLFVANGAVLRGKTYDGCNLGEPWKFFAEPKQIYLNDGAGKFGLLGVAESGPILTDVDLSRGTAGGDLDGDGDFDLVVANLASPHRIYRNDAPRRGSWFVVRTVDPKTKRDAIGSTVVVKCGTKRHLRSISSSWSYLSSSEPWAHFGLGPAKSVDSIHVRWPDGSRERFPGGAVDRRVTVERGKGTAEFVTSKRAERAASRAKRGRKRPVAWFVGLLLVVLALGVAGFARSGRLPSVASLGPAPAESEVPTIERAGMEPRVAAALEAARKDVLANRKSAEAWGRFGMTLDAHEMRGPAAACYRFAHRFDPREFRWVYFLGRVLELEGGEPAEFAKLYRDAARLNPDYAPVQIRLGDALSRENRLPEARAAYEKAVEVEPLVWKGHRGLGQTLLALQKPEEAVASLEQAVALQPRDGASHAALARALLVAGDRERASKEASLSQDLPQIHDVTDPIVAEIGAVGVSGGMCFNRAEDLMALGRFQEAIENLRISEEVTPTNPHVQIRLGRCYQRLGQFEEAIRRYEKAVLLNDDLDGTHLQLGVLLTAAGRLDEALVHLNLARRTLSDAPAHAAVASAYAQKGDFARAFAEFEAGNAAEGDLAASDLINWGSALAQAGRLREAALRFQEAARIDPRSAMAEFNWGRALEDSGDRIGALAHYQASARLNPQGPGAARVRELSTNSQK